MYFKGEETVVSRLQKDEPRCVVSAALFIVGRVGAKNMLRLGICGFYFEKNNAFFHQICKSLDVPILILQFITLLRYNTRNDRFTTKTDRAGIFICKLQQK